MWLILLAQGYAQALRLDPPEPTEGDDVAVIVEPPADGSCEVSVETPDGEVRGATFSAPEVEYPQGTVNLYATFTCELGHASYAYAKLTVWDADCVGGRCLETEAPAGGCSGGGAAGVLIVLLPSLRRKRSRAGLRVRS